MNELQKVSFPVTGMACAACASSVQSMLGAQAGVSSASVNYGNKTARIEFDPAQTSISELSKSLQSIGYGLLTDDSTNRAEFEKLEAVRFQLLRRKLFVALILSLPVFVISMFFHAFAFQVRFALLFMTLPVMFYSGSEFFTNAFKQLRHRIFTMDALVATGTGAAFLLSLANVIFPHALHVNGHQHALYFESAVIIISFVLAGRFFEEKAKAGASSAIRKLAGLQPRTVLVEREGEQFEVPAVHVVPGDRVTIRPGDKIPVDGLILSGISEVDESAITGEPMPVPRKPGDNVFAGSVNRQGLLEVEALKPGNETVLSQIIRLVEEAQSSKPPVQKLVDKIAGIFVPVVIGLAAITFAGWLIFGDSLQLALLNMISVLIIACPCALGLATPTALIAGIGRGASEGILVRDAASLETACKVDTVVFDKTGTLTSGAPVATGIQLNKDPETTAALLYTLEKAANHPLADAVRAGLSGMFPPGASGAMKVTAFENIPGSGIKGVMDGREYVAGNAGFVSGFCQVSLNGKQEPQTPAESVLSEIYFASREELLAVITFTDKMNENTRAAVGALHREGLSLSIMSGDKEEATAALAKLAGIEHWHSGLMPTDKGNKIREMQSQGKVVAMAGDGINDAYALAAANLGIAMGSGTDIAMESAGMVLVKPDISLVAKAISLSRSTVAIIRQNLFWAFFYNVVTIPLAAGLLYPFTGFLLNPMIAGAAMAMSSVSVVSNSLRLTKKKL